LFGNTLAREAYASEEAKTGLVEDEPLQESTGLIRSPGEAEKLGRHINVS